MVRAEIRLREILAYAGDIGDTFRDPLLILNRDLQILSANRAFYDAFQITAAEVQQPFARLGGGVWNTPALMRRLTDTIAARGSFSDFELSANFPVLGERILLLNGATLVFPGSRVPLLALSIEDITLGKTVEIKMSQAQLQDRKIALSLQRPMLFHPKEDAFSGLIVHTAYAVASDEALVGGDFWDTFAFNQRHIALVMGDVMGHGLDSAIFTAELKYTMRAYIREHEHPDHILSQMNQFLFQSNRLFREGINTEGSDVPVCITLAIVERDTGAGALAVAGMAPPLLVQAGQMEFITASGVPLGVLANEEYVQVGFQMETDDTLILYTDGIIEARSGLDFLDEGGLLRLAAEGNGGSLTGMANTILNGARKFAGGNLHDDASLVLVRRTSTSPVITQDHTEP